MKLSCRNVVLKFMEIPDRINKRCEIAPSKCYYYDSNILQGLTKSPTYGSLIIIFINDLFAQNVLNNGNHADAKRHPSILKLDL